MGGGDGDADGRSVGAEAEGCDTGKRLGQRGERPAAQEPERLAEPLVGVHQSDPLVGFGRGKKLNAEGCGERVGRKDALSDVFDVHSTQN